jgi:hypothetical protein
MTRPALIESLPAWCANNAGRKLIYSILASPPETRIVRDDWGSHTIYRTWKRPDVAALKRLHSDWLDRELAALDAQYEVTGKWCEEASRAVLGVETPDQLIKRLLSGNVDRADLEPKSIGDGRFQVAA